MTCRFWTCSALLALACGTPPVIVRPPEDACETACLKLEELECQEAEPTPGPDGVPGNADDGTCVAVCQNAAEQGQGLNSRCVAQAATCAAAEQCQQ